MNIIAVYKNHDDSVFKVCCNSWILTNHDKLTIHQAINHFLDKYKKCVVEYYEI